VNLRDEIYQVMDEKGLHAITYTQQETLVFRQLAHLAIKWGEVWQAMMEASKTDFENVLSDTKVIEELADIIIVAYDLAGIAGVDVKDVITPTCGSTNGIVRIMRFIASTADSYRKTKSLAGLDEIISMAAESIVSWGGDPLEAVQAKMDKNRARPNQYGIAG
jgi:translation initiation factor 2 alpha subunit (eIF-2alpha)